MRLCFDGATFIKSVIIEYPSLGPKMYPPFRKKSAAVVSIWLSIIAIFIVVGLYFFQFNDGLSHSSERWADFGSYVGGVLSPVFAFMAFALGLYTLNQTRQQNRRDELLKCIQGYERDYELCVSKPVTCESPWIWGNELDAADSIQEVALRTLLRSDGVDWELHLPQVASGLKFRVLPDGELTQDRDLFLSAHLAVEGIFRYLHLYGEAGGDASLIIYLTEKYEISRNRLAISSQARFGPH